MNTTAFWELIDKTLQASNGDPYKQAALLVDALIQLPEDDILMYRFILRNLMDQAYTADLWDAAHILGCGCGDDGFMDFRAWLIGRGKETFHKALADPESLGEVVETGQATQVEDLLYVASRAYKLKTGKEMPVMPRKPPELQGESREEQLKLVRFPKLAEKFWKRCLEESR